MIDRVKALFALIFFYEVAEYIQLHYPTNTWLPSDGLEAFLWVMELSLIWFILSKIPPNPRHVVRFSRWIEKNRLDNKHTREVDPS